MRFLIKNNIFFIDKMDNNYENFSNLNFNFEYKNRLIRSTYENNEYFIFDTPFLKVLKPIHINTNKKKNIEKKYIILEINEEYNVNKDLDDFLIIINKLHETSQENIKKNSIKWFNTEFDEIGLDLKVKKPIDKQKDKQFIKILIPNDNEELLEKINNLEKNQYVMTNIFYKGLKVSNDHMMGEYELINLITQEEYEIEKERELHNDKDSLNNILEDYKENNEENQINNEITTEDNNIENNIDENIIEENNRNNEEVNNTEVNNEEVNNEEVNNIEENNIEENNTIITEISNLTSSTSTNKKNNKKNNKFIKFVTRKNKSLIFI